MRNHYYFFSLMPRCSLDGLVLINNGNKRHEVWATGAKFVCNLGTIHASYSKIIIIFTCFQEPTFKEGPVKTW